MENPLLSVMFNIIKILIAFVFSISYKIGHLYVYFTLRTFFMLLYVSLKIDILITILSVQFSILKL